MSEREYVVRHLESKRLLSIPIRTQSQARMSQFWYLKRPKMQRLANKEGVRGRLVTTRQITSWWVRQSRSYLLHSLKKRIGVPNLTTFLQRPSLEDSEKLTSVPRDLDMLLAIQSRSPTEVASRRRLMSASYLTTMLLTSLEWTAKELDIKSAMKSCTTQPTQVEQTEKRL